MTSSRTPCQNTNIANFPALAGTVMVEDHVTQQTLHPVRGGMPGILGQPPRVLALDRCEQTEQQVPGGPPRLHPRKPASDRGPRILEHVPPAGVDFPHARQVLRIQRDICDFDGQRRSKQIVDFVTSHPAGSVTPAFLAAAARQHCGIEAVHWVRDVTWGEDHQHAYTGTGVHTLAVLRNLALSILRLRGLTPMALP